MKYCLLIGQSMHCTLIIFPRNIVTQYQEYKEPSDCLEIRNFEVIEFTQENDYDFIEVSIYKIII